MRHIGIYSGTFDPVHAGHLAFADEAQRAGELDYVIFMPEEQPRGKVHVSSIEQRIAFLQHKLTATHHEIYRANHPRFSIAQTVPELAERYQDAAFSFLMGSDIVSSLHAWPGIESFVTHHRLIIGMRAGDGMEDVVSTLDQLQASYTIVTTPHAHMSSRQLRQTP